MGQVFKSRALEMALTKELKFLPNFGGFFKLEHTGGNMELWKIIKNGKSLEKNEEKPSSTCIQPFSCIEFLSRDTQFINN